MTRRADADRSGALALGTAYLTNFGALAASSPFLALYLGSVGFTPPLAAQLLALALLVRVVAIPPWTLFADRTHASGAVLRLASAGALVSFVALLADPTQALVALALLVFSAFRAPFGPLLDAIMLRRARATGGAFGAVRAWGTAGYALGAVVTGAVVAHLGSRGVLYASVVFLTAALLAGWTISGGGASPGVRGGGGRQLVAFVRRPRLVILLLIALLSQLGLAPYDALFPAYLTRLAGSTAAGAAVAIGAGAEFVFLLAGPSLARGLGAERLLAAACAVSTVRWTAMALVTNPVALVLLQALHALSFGAFYMSAVILVDVESPPGLRASAQGIFASLCFGVAAAVGLSVAGLVERHGGIPAVFSVAAVASLLATIVASLLHPHHRSGPAGRVERIL
ncbi:MAG TPA: MFS transporter [Polyangiaceae bacterium]